MGLRFAISVRLTPKKGKLKGGVREAACVANAGYEPVKAEMVVPARLAEVLGLLAELPEGARNKVYRTAAGPIRTSFVDDCIEAQVVTENWVSELVTCGVATSELRMKLYQR